MTTWKSRLGALVDQLWFDQHPGMAARLAGAAMLPLTSLTRRYATGQRRKIQALKQIARNQADEPIVIVVGNLVAGGAGKTPLTIALCHQLSRNHRVGIICRGDGARSVPARPVAVRWPADADQVGDEAVLMARATGVPVYACRHRALALQALAKKHPDIQIILSDDGLQHAALTRHIELAVFGPRGTGNARLLPAGPLREPLSHLDQMDAIVCNDGWAGAISPPLAIAHPRRFRTANAVANLIPLNEYLHSAAGLEHRDKALNGGQLPGEQWLIRQGIRMDKPIAAIAGVANPESFFDVLRALGLNVIPCPRADHERMAQATLNAIDASQLVMTEKDAVKCRGLSDPRAFVLQIAAQPDPALAKWLVTEAQRIASI